MKGLQSQECKPSKLLQLRQLLPRHALLVEHMLLQAPAQELHAPITPPIYVDSFPVLCAHPSKASDQKSTTNDDGSAPCGRHDACSDSMRSAQEQAVMS